MLVVPTYHPAAVLRQWSWRYIAVQDLRRALALHEDRIHEPAHQFHIDLSYEDCTDLLRGFLSRADGANPVRLSCDIETRGGHIDCVGFGWGEGQAACIPLFTMERGASCFELPEELEIVRLLRKVLTHSNIQIIGQNYYYDAQYFARHYGILSEPWLDTMVAHAVCFPGLPKSLDFLSSLYLDWHQYWKDESKEANAKVDDHTRWIYNCKDCHITYDLADPILSTIESLDLREAFEIERKMFRPLMLAMLRGVRIDLRLRSKLLGDLLAYRSDAAQWFEKIMEPTLEGLSLVKSKTAKPWYDSPKQQQTLFFEILGVKPVRNRKSGNPTADDAALELIGKREPLLLPVIRRLIQYRSAGVFLNTFVRAPLDRDSRIRSSYNPVGTETFRLNSRRDAFGYGTNLQNIPTGDA